MTRAHDRQNTRGGASRADYSIRFRSCLLGVRWKCPPPPHEALGIFVHDVHRRWASVFWRSWARVIRGRLPAIGRPNADILNHGPPPAYARGQAAVGGAEPWPRVQPGVLRGLRAAAGLCVL